MGSTRKAACEDLSRLIATYLRNVYDDGEPLNSALRPLSTLRKLRMILPLRSRARLVLFPGLH